MVTASTAAIRPRPRTLLELGSGGGNMASHLKRDLRLTLTDLSMQMLDESRRINPEAEHLVGDINRAAARIIRDVADRHDRPIWVAGALGPTNKTLSLSPDVNDPGFREIDFVEKTRKGAVAGTTFDDWPITYADLEPYYTRAEWEVGVSGQAGVNPNEALRSRPYPMPPLPITGAGAVMEIGAKKLGWLAQPAPMAILSSYPVPHRALRICIIM